MGKNKPAVIEKVVYTIILVIVAILMLAFLIWLTPSHTFFSRGNCFFGKPWMSWDFTEICI